MINNTVQRPFRVLGIQQVAIGGTDKQRMKALWVDRARTNRHFQATRERR